MNRRSVRWRLTVLATTIAAIVLAIVGIVVVTLVATRLRDNLDNSLEQRADQVEALAVEREASALANQNAEDRFAQIVDADGNVLGASTNVEGAPLLSELPAVDGPALVFTTRDDLPLEDDGYRVLTRRFDVGDTVQYVVVGENVDDLRESVAAVRTVIAVLFPIAALVVGAMVWWLVGRALRPVEAIRREVVGIGLDALDHRVPSPGTGDEIDRLAGTMNDMLARLDAASAQQRRFVADASHELRTPLTRLRTAFEVELARPATAPSTVTREALGDVVEMQALVDDLLFLARVDAGRARRPPSPVDLDAVVDAVVAEARAEGGAAITVTAEPVVVAGDDRQLARLVRNLLANALRFATSEVRVEVRSDPGGARIVVADDGPGIPAAARERVFDRFVRLDEARDGDRGGSGLGLAIVRDIARLHGGDVAVQDGRHGGARFVVTLPGGGASTPER